jgi:hypothetical protein
VFAPAQATILALAPLPAATVYAASPNSKTVP